jgi:hypothetical protein
MYVIFIMTLIYKYKLYYLIPIAFVGILFLSLHPNYVHNEHNEHNRDITQIRPDFSKFDDYWYQGKAEITSFDLQQARYGQLYQGSAVLIFVTEPFSKSKQVKLNTTHRNEQDAVKVLKLNFSKKFVTGIYDYSILQSVFTPVDLDTYKNTIKVTTSIQDWCGHTFTQLNLQTYKYKVLLNSYFETEGDQEFQIEQAMLEDEIWNLIRISPNDLPVGQIELIPSVATAQMRHSQLALEDVDAALDTHVEDTNLMTYHLKFITSQRSLKIHYHKKFPYEIEGWEETYIDNGKQLTTKATRKKTILSDYWNENSPASKPLRKQLGLD